MEKMWKLSRTLKIGIVCLMIATSACSKSKTSTAASTADTDSTDGYITCPSTGYYFLNNTRYSCSSGETLYVGTSSSAYYVTCPSTGQYTYSGTTYTCTSGDQIYVGNTDGTVAGDGCDSYNRIYGVTYVPVRYQGELVCMQESLAQEYGYSSTSN